MRPASTQSASRSTARESRSARSSSRTASNAASLGRPASNAGDAIGDSSTLKRRLPSFALRARPVQLQEYMTCGRCQ